MRGPRGSIGRDASSRRTMSGRVKPEGANSSSGQQEVGIASLLKCIKKCCLPISTSPTASTGIHFQSGTVSAHPPALVARAHTHTCCWLPAPSTRNLTAELDGAPAESLARILPHDLCRALSPRLQSADTAPAALSQDVVGTTDCIWKKKM